MCPLRLIINSAAQKQQGTGSRARGEKMTDSTRHGNAGVTRQWCGGRMRLPGYATGAALLTCLLLPVAAQATIDVTVNETIVPDNCELTLGGLDGTGALDWGNLDASTLSTTGAVSAVKTFTLALTKCGNTYGSTVPTITVSGNTPSIPASAQYQFRDAKSKAKNVGFILRFNDSKVTWVGGANPPNLKSGTTIAEKNGDLTLPATWKNGTPMNIAVALSTGDLTGQTAGYVQAGVTFTFEYK